MDCKIIVVVNTNSSFVKNKVQRFSYPPLKKNVFHTPSKFQTPYVLIFLVLYDQENILFCTWTMKKTFFFWTEKSMKKALWPFLYVVITRSILSTSIVALTHKTHVYPKPHCLPLYKLAYHRDFVLNQYPQLFFPLLILYILVLVKERNHQLMACSSSERPRKYISFTCFDILTYFNCTTN